MPEPKSHHERLESVQRTLLLQTQRLERRRIVGFSVAVFRRYLAINGGNYAGLMAIELFTTVLPLMILGFGYFTGFARNVSVGSIFVNQLGLSGHLDQTVRAAFGPSDGLRSQWTVFGMAGFLVWGIPMAVTLAGIFARAWRRDPFSFGQRLGRGAAWFVLYLLTLSIHDLIAFSGTHGGPVRVLLFIVSLLPLWAFWTFTPALLVRNGCRSVRTLASPGWRASSSTVSSCPSRSACPSH